MTAPLRACADVDTVARLAWNARTRTLERPGHAVQSLNMRDADVFDALWRARPDWRSAAALWAASGLSVNSVRIALAALRKLHPYFGTFIVIAGKSASRRYRLVIAAPGIDSHAGAPRMPSPDCAGLDARAPAADVFSSGAEPSSGDPAAPPRFPPSEHSGQSRPAVPQSVGREP